MNKLLFFITRYLRMKKIGADDQGNAYMERYYLGKFGNKTFYIHRFLRPDKERCLHNHPWLKCGSVILYGSYEEICEEWYPANLAALFYQDLATLFYGGGGCRTTFKPYMKNKITEYIFHTIDTLNNNCVWTLFWHESRQRNWGFLISRNIPNNEGLFRTYTKYFNIPQETYNPETWQLTAPKGKDTDRPFRSGEKVELRTE